MPEATKQNSIYHLSAQVSDTYFSYKKPADGKAYSLMFIKMYDNNITLHFKRGITSENVLDLDCHMHKAKALDVAQWLEGFMARRRDAYINNKPYDAQEMIKIPITSYKRDAGTEVPTGILTLDTEMIEGIPRLRVTYLDHEKNDSIEIVFNKRVPNGTIEMTHGSDIKIDYADVSAYDFVTTFKELFSASIPIVYRLQDAAVSTVIKFISKCFSNQQNRKNYNNNGSYNRNAKPSGNYSAPPQDEPPVEMSNEWPDDDAF